MALKTRSNPMGALGVKYYTLTVNTDPSSATCTLTYDGVAHTEKSAEVKEGTVISYSIYHSTYGTTTGSITMNSNKTLTCNGTYSTSETESSWSNPILSANGTIGGSSFAVYASSVYSTSYQAYHAVDGGTTYWRGTSPCYWEWYTPNPSKPTYLTLTALTSAKNGYYQAVAFDVQYSTNNSSWTTLYSHNNSSRPKTVSISLNPSTACKYWRINITSGAIANAVIYPTISISGKQVVTSNTYYWDKSIS